MDVLRRVMVRCATPIQVTVLQSPHYLTNPVDPAAVENKGDYAALGIDADSREALRKAVRGLIN